MFTKNAMHLLLVQLRSLISHFVKVVDGMHEFNNVPLSLHFMFDTRYTWPRDDSGMTIWDI